MAKIKYPLLSNAFNSNDINCGVKVLKSKQLTMSKITEKFEKKFSAYIGKKYCIGVGNGMDALTISLKSYASSILDLIILALSSAST